jgi:hypothetical protein
MFEMVKVLYDDYLEWKRPFQEKSSKKEKIKGEDPTKPPSSPPSYTSSSSSSTNSTSTTRKRSHKHKHEMPSLNIDLKFEFPMYDGEVNVERLDDWAR